jgi:hypothetical protein
MDINPKLPVVNMPLVSLETEIGEGLGRLATQNENMERVNKFRQADRKVETNTKAAIESCLRTGSVMKALFPEGLRLKSEEEFAVFRLFDRLVGDLANFARTGMKRSTSLRDISLHAGLLETVITSEEGKGREFPEQS